MTDRENCPMRLKNGNCLPCGGFCTAVNDEICRALHGAYHMGYEKCTADGLFDFHAFGGGVDDW